MINKLVLNKQNVKSLEEMVSYNSKFIDIIQDDPIIRISKLKASRIASRAASNTRSDW